MANASTERLILQRKGWTTTDLSIDDTWVDQKGHTRIVKLRKDGDYNTICTKRHERVEKAKKDHARWRKNFMRRARVH